MPPACQGHVETGPLEQVLDVHHHWTSGQASSQRAGDVCATGVGVNQPQASGVHVISQPRRSKNIAYQELTELKHSSSGASRGLQQGKRYHISAEAVDGTSKGPCARDEGTETIAGGRSAVDDFERDALCSTQRRAAHALNDGHIDGGGTISNWHRFPPVSAPEFHPLANDLEQRPRLATQRQPAVIQRSPPAVRRGRLVSDFDRVAGQS